tara:strand:+ start:58 stop:990 length:933 start_codon:yes stop_codon:yes gene_type:complete
MGLLNDIFASGRNVMPMGSKEANRTEPFTAGGILQRDPNLSFGAGLKDFKQSFQPEAGFASMGSAEYNANLKAARAKRIEDTKPTSSVDTKVKTETENKPDVLLPDAKLKDKSFMGKLQSGIDKIFTMQENDPKGYAAMMSGIDLYSRSQTQDLATALLGNNKYNADQANALMQSNMNAMTYKMTVAKYAEALKKGAEINIDDNEKLIAKSFLAGKVKDDNLDSYTAVIATLAKRRSVETGIPYEEILPALFNEMQSSGALKDKSLFSSNLTLDPSKIGVVNVDNYDQSKFDALPKGTRFTRDGKEYIKQ